MPQTETALETATRLTPVVTAFPAFMGPDSLMAAMSTGYVPTLRSDEASQRDLGVALENCGLRVHWLK